MGRDTGSPSALRHVRTYPSSPRRLDPCTAPAQTLLRHGFPRRPDPVREPELARLWERAFARRTRLVQAELAIDPVMSARDPLRRSADRFGATGWAGAVQRLWNGSGYYEQPATLVFAQWQLPYVAPITPNEKIAVAFWVGLDGDSAIGEPASRQVLQAGVAAQVNPGYWPWQSTWVKWWAWTEWFSELHRGEPANSALAVRNFPVKAGDTVFVVVCAPEPRFGFVSMMNVTRGIGVSVGFDALAGIAAQGRSAEWIVEIPTQSPYAPSFTPVTFDGCMAGSMQGVFDLTGAGTLDIRAAGDSGNPYGHPVTQTTLAPPTTAVVRQLELDWF